MPGFTVGEVIFPGSVWFIIHKPLPSDISGLARAAVRGSWYDRDQKRNYPVVYAFSDPDLAQRCLLESFGTHAESCTIHGIADYTQLIAFLRELESGGDKYVGTDKGHAGGCLQSINFIICELRERGS